MYFYLSIILLVLGLVLIASPDTILSQESEYQKTIRDNSKVLGATLLGASYYTYTISTSDDSPTTPYLPSYDEATSTEQ